MTSFAIFADQVRRGTRTQGNVIFALLFKEFKRASGVGRLGTFWAFITPGITAGIIGGVWTLLGRKDFDGVPSFLVMSVSLIPHWLVRRSYSTIPFSIETNMGLYGYPQVKPIDALLARFLFDVIFDLLGSVILVLFSYWFLNMVPVFLNPLGLVILLAVICATMLGVSLICGIFALRSDTFSRVLGFISRPMMFVSLVFILGNTLPTNVRYWVSFNPIADVNELLRYYALGIRPMPEATLTYPTIVSIVILAAGFLVYYTNRHEILRQD